MKYIIVSFLFCFVVVCDCISQKTAVPAAASDMNARAKADTTGFKPNKKSDWSIYSSYLLDIGKDSVSLEVVVAHSRNINWQEYQLVGKIADKRMLPLQTIETAYFLLSDEYQIKIENNGNCYLRLAAGQLPPRDPVIIPVKLTFKKI